MQNRGIQFGLLALVVVIGLIVAVFSRSTSAPEPEPGADKGGPSAQNRESEVKKRAIEYAKEFIIATMERREMATVLMDDFRVHRKRELKGESGPVEHWEAVGQIQNPEVHHWRIDIAYYDGQFCALRGFLDGEPLTTIPEPPSAAMPESK